MNALKVSPDDGGERREPWAIISGTHDQALPEGAQAARAALCQDLAENPMSRRRASWERAKTLCPLQMSDDRTSRMRALTRVNVNVRAASAGPSNKEIGPTTTARGDGEAHSRRCPQPSAKEPHPIRDDRAGSKPGLIPATPEGGIPQTARRASADCAVSRRHPHDHPPFATGALTSTGPYATLAPRQDRRRADYTVLFSPGRGVSIPLRTQCLLRFSIRHKTSSLRGRPPRLTHVSRRSYP